MFNSLRLNLRRLRASREFELQKVILGLLEQEKSCRLLDLGCGDGSFTQKLAKKIDTTQVYAIEILEEFIELARQRGIEVRKGDLNEALPLDSESFDVVHAKEVLEHLNHTDLFLKEIHRVLKPGEGYTVISVPNLAGWHNIFSLIVGWQPFSTHVSDEIVLGNPLNYAYGTHPCGSHEYPLHRRIPTFRSLKELLQYHHFEIEKTVGAGYYLFVGS